MASKGQKNDFSEKDFASNGSKKHPHLIWVFLLIVIAIIFFMWALNDWQEAVLEGRKGEDPFLKVTNREFSLFLWQNPEYMRVNAKSRSGYLPGFASVDNVHLLPQLAEEIVAAPAEIIFRYHVWKRLIGNWVAKRSILGKEFQKFLDDCPEWKPEFWTSDSSKNYLNFVKQLAEHSESEVPSDVLPFEVRLAFQGWKNYFEEGESINQVQATFQQMDQFLKSYPHYQRSYWRNILEETSVKYLMSYLNEARDEESLIPKNEMAAFLRVGFYNFQKQNPIPQ